MARVSFEITVTANDKLLTIISALIEQYELLGELTPEWNYIEAEKCFDEIGTLLGQLMELKRCNTQKK